jgi:hypothetical protein
MVRLLYGNYLVELKEKDKMNKVWMAVIAVLVSVGLVFLVVVSGVISTNNEEVNLRTAIEQKQKDNTSEFDNVWKKIGQTAQVTDKQQESLKEIFVEHAQARTGSGQGGEVMKWVQESVPNVDTATFRNLQNIITGSRDAFTQRQKELLDLKREHDGLLRRFPSGVILSVLGRKPIEVVIVTSERTEKAFESGKDENIQVFAR